MNDAPNAIDPPLLRPSVRLDPPMARLGRARRQGVLADGLPCRAIVGICLRNRVSGSGKMAGTGSASRSQGLRPGARELREAKMSEALARVRNEYGSGPAGDGVGRAGDRPRPLAGRARALPARVYVGAAFFGAARHGVNALLLQRERHPAPLFGPARRPMLRRRPQFRPRFGRRLRRTPLPTLPCSLRLPRQRRGGLRREARRLPGRIRSASSCAETFTAVNPA